MENGYYNGLSQEGMKVIRSLDRLPALECSVLTIGNFDGFHLGHQAIFRALNEAGTRRGLPRAAITFEPHPLELIAPERAPLAISTPAQRERLIEAAGADVLFIQTFDRPFSRLTPEEFIARYVIDAFRAQVLSVGENFRFGCEHRGSIATLDGYPDQFDLIAIPPVVLDGTPVSSSLVRTAIAEGDVARAGRLLGRSYEIEGRRIPGTGRGAQETVPTLNMQPDNRLRPGRGVYLTEIALDDEAWLQALTNVGTRPTFNGGGETIETHVPDREIPAGAGRLRLRFLERLRDERRFNDTSELREQILRDIERAREFFDARKP
jgi:riboflavin kinase / FMN adenylyltransferase